MNKKASSGQYISLVFTMLIGAVIGFIALDFSEKFGSRFSSYENIILFIGFVLVIYLAFYFHIIVHESGHLIFGLLTGYRFSSFRIFSFMLIKENGKFRLKRFSLVGTGGQCLMDPPDISGGDFPTVLYNLGGSLMNFFASSVFLAVYLIFPKLLFLSHILFIFSAVGYWCALINGIPMRMGMTDNDGYNAFSLSQNKEAKEAFWIQLKVASENTKGIRLKDMPSKWFAIPSDEAMKNSLVASCAVFACNRLMDKERFEETDALAKHLLEIESGIIGIHKNLLICDRIYIELIGQNQCEIIKSMLDENQKSFMKAMKHFPSVIRTQYALALLFEKNENRAKEIKTNFEKAARSYPYPHEIASERDLMELALEKSEKEVEQ